MANTSKSAGQALNEKAIDCLRQRDYAGAKLLLIEATQTQAEYLPAWTNLAGVLRNLREFDAALKAVDGALRIEPRSFFALFFRATILEEIGQDQAAAGAYTTSFLCAPPESQQDEATRQALVKARAFVERINDAKADFLRGSLNDVLKDASVRERNRADILIGNLTGKRKPFVQEPLIFNYPHMPAIEFWDRSELPWIAKLEAATSEIQNELKAILVNDSQGLTPYIHYGEGLPIDQWAQLNHNPDWSAYHLIEAGLRVESHAAQCPKTMAALGEVPFPVLSGRSPVALFSVLKPRTHIPPHTGASNARLLCHLPLIVPEGCRYRVGGSWREWKVGAAFVFDDTIEHEAFNDSDQIRVILIFDIWNPRLSDTDKAIITQATLSLDAFNGRSGLRQDWT
jgi:aspartate beta-hydroxylase